MNFAKFLRTLFYRTPLDDVSIILHNFICISCALMDERKLNFLQKILMMLPLNNCYNEWTQLLAQINVFIFVAKIFV